MEKRRPWLVLLTMIVVCILPFTNYIKGYSQPLEQSIPASKRAQDLLNVLTPEERVGQLFLVTFDGYAIDESSPIFELIRDYHVGGVVLKRTNNNFFDGDNTIINARELIKNIQEMEWLGTTPSSTNKPNDGQNHYIPLFMGISQSGDIYPYDQILSGVTQLPSQMAIGATWNRNLSETVGEVLGRELEAIGFNLIFTPSLDVLDITYSEGKDYLGTQTFGGDPFWVSVMGNAYIKGLHQGGKNRILVIVKNFPGRGSSDRLPDEEVATVRKSLEQLKLIELLPFFAAADVENKSEESLADGLLLSHIRYQGFQGNIRATTKPISFDQTAVDQIMSLDTFQKWREKDGILVSDDLGSPAMKKFFDPTGQSFDARQVARNAFLAGNDMLLMDQFISTGDLDRYTTYKRTIDLFVQKYKEDQAFAERVNASALRILTKKFEIYNTFNYEIVIPSEADMAGIGQGQEIVFEVASRAASLISPSVEQLNDSLPRPPELGEQIIIFTDEIKGKQCDSCTPVDIFPVDYLQKSIVRLYGPSGSGQINPNQIISYSFTDLQDYIENPFNRIELETNLSRAEWVVFACGDLSGERPSSYALKNLITNKPNIIRNKKVIVFSFNAPYYYDATDISAFTAYYGLYSKAPAFVDVAARILFQEINPLGSSPVSVPGIVYDLITVTSPHPTQIIPLAVDNDYSPAPSDPQASESRTLIEGQPTYRLGDLLPVKTGVIYDHNKNPVPDGTVVRFLVNMQGENVTIQQVEATTVDGIARVTIKLQSPGLHEIKAISEPAQNSEILILDISQDVGAVISSFIPTPIPTKVIESLPIEEGDQSEMVPEEPEKQKKSMFMEWLLSTLFIWTIAATFFSISKPRLPIKMRIRITAWMLFGGSLAILWMLIRMSGTLSGTGLFSYIAVLLIALTGSLFAGGTAWLFFGKSEGI